MEDGRKKTRGKLIPALVFLVVISMTAGIFLYRDRVAGLGNYGYLGVFLISLISSATIVLPIPTMLLLFAFGAILNPVLVGLAASLGGTLGEITGYLLGRSVSKLAVSEKIYERTEKWVRKFGMIAVFIFALVPPLPIDIAGIAAGALRFPVWKFLLSCFAGKMILYTGMAFAGAWGWDIVARFFT